MNKSKYQMMKESIVTDENGNPYPDIATFPLQSFIATSKPLEVKLSYVDTQRFFDLTYRFYESFDFYDDITLWLNDIDYISDSEENFEKIIKIYSKIDIDNWYLASVKGEVVDKDKRIII